MDRTVIALFDDLRHAHRAVEALRRSRHFTSEDITLMAHDADNRYSRYITKKHVERTEATKAGTGAAAGMGIGGAVGALAGLLVGLGVIFIPGLGPIVAAGPVAATLLGAAGGAAAGGIIGALVGLGIPEDEAHVYAEALRRGGTLVLVKTDTEHAREAATILARHRPVDVEDRAETWRQSGWTGRYEPDEPARREFVHEPLYEPIEGEPHRRESQPREREHHEAHRTEEPVHMHGEAPYDEAHYHGATRIYPPLQERREDLEDQEPVPRLYRDLEPEFRHHFQSTHATDERFEDYEEGYRFGAMLAADDRFRQKTWPEIEQRAQASWSQMTRESWDRFKDTVTYAWYRVKSAFDDGREPSF